MTRLPFLKSAALVTAVLCHVGTALAQVDVATPERPEWTIYAGQGVDANLTGLPKQVLRGDIRWEPSYFTAVGYAKPIPLPGWMRGTGANGPTGTVELIGVQHRGLQSNFEADLAVMLRTGYAQVGPAKFRAGFGLGLSYAFGTPSYEDGSAAEPARRYRFQNYNAIELEGGLNQFPNTSLVTRVHHRSGFYGLIAPRQVGSNFLTVGVRHRF